MPAEDISLISSDTVRQRCGNIGKSLFHGMIRAGKFPLQPVRLGRSVKYRSDELSLWIQSGCPSADRWRNLRQISKGAM